MSVKERWKGTRPVEMGTEEALSLLLPLLQSDQRIQLVYLFGSRAAGKATELSDMDIGICTSFEFQWDDYYLLYGEMTRLLRSDRLDLLWLNKADPVMRFEVIRGGKVLFYQDPDMLNDFELKTKKGFYDYSLYLRKHRSYRENGL